VKGGDIGDNGSDTREVERGKETPKLYNSNLIFLSTSEDAPKLERVKVHC